MDKLTIPPEVLGTNLEPYWDDFLLYWEEPFVSGRLKDKPRWMGEKTWKTKSRLIRWAQNQVKWSKPKSDRELDQDKLRTDRIDSGFKSLNQLIK